MRPARQWAFAEAALKLQRQREQEAAVRHHQDDDRDQAGCEPGGPEHAQVQQRIAAPQRDPPLHRDEHRRQDHACADAGEDPPGPVLLMAQHQREHDREDGRDRDGQPSHVNAPGAARRVAGDDARGHEQDGQADGDVDEEDGAPAAAEQVRVHQQAAEDLARDEAGGQHRGIGAQRPGPVRPGETRLDDAHDLRHRGGGSRALDEPRGDEHRDAGREPAHGRAEGENDDAREEHLAASSQVTEPGSGDEQHGVAHCVAGHDELKLGPGGVQGPADGRQRDVHDRDVEQSHELAGQQDRQHDPAPPARARRGAGFPQDGFRCRGHDPSLRDRAWRRREPADAGVGTTWLRPRPGRRPECQYPPLCCCHAEELAAGAGGGLWPFRRLAITSAVQVPP